MDILDINAEIYCMSAKHTIKVQEKQLQERLKWMTDEMLRKKQCDMPYDDFIANIVNRTKESIMEEGWSLTDVNGISWFISLYACAYFLIKPECSFDKIFIDAFKCYHHEIPFLQNSL